jgi:NAD(P)-dependent dehydrogenase (short-subunit alcohol dehydrogenase family)
VHFFHHVVYGVGKAALDRIATDAAPTLKRHGVAIVSLWPHLVKTERVVRIPGFDLTRAESMRFTGRAVVALARDPDVLRWTGRALTSRDLAHEYGFTDVDGTLPDGPAWRPPA